MMNGWNSLAVDIPNLIIAILVFLVGWIIAKVIEKGVDKAFKKINMDDKLFPQSTNRNYSSGKIISKIVFYILMVFVIVLVLNILSMNLIATPLVNMLSSITAVVPSLLKAALILLFAWILASGLRFIIRKAGNKLNVQKLVNKWNTTETTEVKNETIIEQASNLVFYFVLLLFLPGVLAALDIEGVSGPFTNMLNGVLSFLPTLFAATLILVIGWFVAKLCRVIVTNFLLSIGTERVVNRFGMKKYFESTSLSAIAGHIVFVVILIPVVISALETLNIAGISTPAIEMLNVILTMVPNIITAILFVIAGIWIGGYVKKIVSGTLRRVGFDSIISGMGYKTVDPQTSTQVSVILGNVAQVLVSLLFIVQALHILQLDFMVALASGVIAYLPQVLVATLIIAVGLYVGNFIQRLLKTMFVGDHFGLLSSISKYAIIAFSIFMALDQLGVADTIVNSAFILILGGVALAFGLAFGLGGKDTAAKYMRKLDHKIENTEVHVPSQSERPAFWTKSESKNHPAHKNEHIRHTPMTTDPSKGKRNRRSPGESQFSNNDNHFANSDGVNDTDLRHSPNSEKGHYPEYNDRRDPREEK